MTIDKAQTPAQWTDNGRAKIRPINWNRIEDPKDLEVWNRLTSNFWLPEKVPVANDIPTWTTMSDAAKTATLRVFTGLTLLDTLQGTVGAIAMLPHSETPHEEAVYTNIAFMESVHAKSYSNIFSTLASTPEIDEAFEWSENNEQLQRKAEIVLRAYKAGDPLNTKILSVLLESFLFYSGFYLPLRFATEGVITNSADMIRLIMRDEAVHGYYIGYKLQKALDKLPRSEYNDIQDFVVDVLMDLHENEKTYTHDIYDDLGWTDDVFGYLNYNANKSMQNMGFESLYPQDICQMHPGVLTALNLSSENHDFFAGSGSSYVIGTAEQTSDEDWEF